METTTAALARRHRAVERERYRVLKTLRPGDRGAIALARRYGDALICVRHRGDARGKVRHVTVELLVDSVPIQPRARPMVHLRIEPAEQTLRAIIRTAGGRWDPKTQSWTLPSRVVSILNLRHRIVRT